MRPQRRIMSDKIRDIHSRIDYTFFKLFHTSRPVNPNSIKKILCFELLYLGDLIVTTPSIKALKETFPDSEITFVLPPGMKAVLEGNPNVKHIIEFDPKNLNPRGIKEFSRSLRSMHFDMAVLFYPGNKAVSKLLKKSKIPIRVGSSKTGFLEGKGKYLTHKVRPTLEKKHYVEENLDVVRAVGADVELKKLELYTDVNIDNFLNKHGLSGNKKLIVVHPGPRNPTHKWLNLRFSAVIDALIEKHNVKVILTGTKKDESDIQEIVNTTKNEVITTVGMTLDQYFAVIQRADLVISVDTGAMHVAAAFDRPVVALFGAGDPKVWRPYTEHFRVLFKPQMCTNCMSYKCRFKGDKFIECMKSITVEDVLMASDELLSKDEKKETKKIIPTTQELFP
jgi:heptosyltransferase II